MEWDDYNELESHFDAMNAWSCKHCGELVPTDAGEMQVHLERCEYYE